MMHPRKTCSFLAAALAAGLWASMALAQPAWEQAGEQLRAARLPAAQAEALIAQSKSRNVSPERFARWSNDMAQLGKAGIPATIFAERVAQGLAKSVPEARLDAGLSTLRDNLLWAHGVLAAHVARAEIRNKPALVEQGLRGLEAALRADFTREQMEQILGRQPLELEQLAALSRTAASLRSWGLEQEPVVRALQHAGAAGMDAARIDGLERRFAAGMAAGRAPGELLGDVARTIEDFRRTRPEPVRMERDIQRSFQREFGGPGAPGGPGGPGGGGGFPSGGWGR